MPVELCGLCGSREHRTEGHGETLGLTWFTVCGVWPETRERWADHYQAIDPRTAEMMARMDAQSKGGVLWVTNVFEGQLVPVDTYAKFADDPDRTTRADF